MFTTFKAASEYAAQLSYSADIWIMEGDAEAGRMLYDVRSLDARQYLTNNRHHLIATVEKQSKLTRHKYVVRHESAVGAKLSFSAAGSAASYISGDDTLPDCGPSVSAPATPDDFLTGPMFWTLGLLPSNAGDFIKLWSEIEDKRDDTFNAKRAEQDAWDARAYRAVRDELDCEVQAFTYGGDPICGFMLDNAVTAFLGEARP